MHNNSGFWVKAFLFSGLALVTISLIIMLTMTPSIKTKPSSNTNVGILNNDPSIGGDFSLINANNKVVNSQKLRGKMLLIYFGFTYCPDICPASLYEMSKAINQINDRDKVEAIFITVDPDRDTPQQLKEYFNDFDSRIIPLTGTPQEIDKVAKQFRVYYARSTDTPDKNYLINHSSFFYLVDDSGKFIKYYPSGIDGNEMGMDILRYKLSR